MIARLIARFLGLFPEVRKLRGYAGKYDSLLTVRAELITKNDLISLKLRDTERALEIMTEARLNVDRSFEFHKGEVEALKEAHAREVLSLKQTIDAFAPSAIGRTVYGLAPEPKPLKEEPQAQGSITRRSSQREAMAAFLQEANLRAQSSQGLSPNPNGDEPNFSKQ